MTTPTTQLRCRITFMDSEHETGDVFLPENTRLIDLMNGEKPFIAFKANGEDFSAISKQAIKRIQPEDQPAEI